jgi:hypothetical protein
MKAKEFVLATSESHMEKNHEGPSTTNVPVLVM